MSLWVSVCRVASCCLKSRTSGSQAVCNALAAPASMKPSCPPALLPLSRLHANSMAKYPLVVQSDCTADVKTEVVDICVTAV